MDHHHQVQHPSVIASDEFILSDTYTFQDVEIYVTYTNTMQQSDTIICDTFECPSIWFNSGVMSHHHMYVNNINRQRSLRYVYIYWK